MRRISIPLSVFVLLFFISAIVKGQTINVNPITLSTFFATYGGVSTAKSFTINGSSLTSNIMITCTAGFEISKTPGGLSGYAAVQTLTQTAGTVSLTTIYVRLNVSASVSLTGSSTSKVVCTSGSGPGAINKEVTLSNIIVSKKALTVFAANQTKTYGVILPSGAGQTTNFTDTGLVNGNSIASVTLTSSGFGAGANVSTYPISPSVAVGAVGTDLNNYQVTYVNGTLIVSKKALTVFAANQTKTYGVILPSGAGQTTNFTDTGLVNGNSIASVTLTSSGFGAGANVSTYPISPSVAVGAVGTDLTNYQVTYVNGTLIVGKKALTVFAANQTKTYGVILPSGAGQTTNFTDTGLVNGNSIASVTLTSSGFGAGANVSTYPISPSVAVGAVGTDLNNYQVTYVNGTLIVSKKALTVFAANQTKTYGVILPSGAGQTTNFTDTGLVNGNSIASVTLTSSGFGAGANVSTYPISPSVAVGAVGTDLNNYQVTYVNGTLIVSKKALTVFAANQTKTYGVILPSGAGQTTNFTDTGLVNGNSIASVTLTSSGFGAGANVSTYPISPSVAVGAVGTDLNNYQVTYVNGTLIVSKKALTVFAANQTKTYGVILPSGAGQTTNFTDTGLVNGNSIASVTLTSSGFGAGANVSTYPISPSVAVGAVGTDLNNYQVTYVNGTLIVGKKALTVFAANQTKTYGVILPSGAGQTTNFTDTGLVNGNSIASVTLTSSGFGAGANVSTYPISPSVAVGAVGTDLTNYQVTYKEGLLTVSKRDLAITAKDASKCQGFPLVFNPITGPNQSFNISGLVNSDRVDSVQLSSDGSPEGALPNFFPISINSASGLGLSNYNIIYKDGILTVNAKPKITNANLTICDNSRLNLPLQSDLPSTFTWAALPNTFGGGNGTSSTITDFLNSTTHTTIIDTVSYEILAKTISTGCPSDLDTVKVALKLLPDVPTISILATATPPPPIQLCQNSNQNYTATIGSTNSTTNGVIYTWSSIDALLILANSKTTPEGKNAVFQFPTTPAGTYHIKVTDSVSEINGCTNTNTITIGPLGTANTTPNTIIYNGSDFVCLNNNVNATIDGYQWGYDDNNLVPHNYTTEAPFVNAQNLPAGPGIDTTKQFVWVLTKSGACFTKTYFVKPYPRRPAGSTPVTVSQIEPIKIYPNPVHNEAVITWGYTSATDKATITITDIAGRKLLIKSIAPNLTPGRAVVKLGGLPKGMYLVNVFFKNKSSAVGKLMKE